MIDPKTLRVGDKFWQAGPAIFGKRTEVEAVYVREIFPGLGPSRYGNGGWESCRIEYGYKPPRCYATPEEALAAYFQGVEASIDEAEKSYRESIEKRRTALEARKTAKVEVIDRGFDYQAPDL